MWRTIVRSLLLASREGFCHTGLCASAVGPDHLLASGTKDQAGGHVWALAPSPKRLVLIAHSIRPRFEYLTSGYL